MGCRCRGKMFAAMNRVLLVVSYVCMKFSRSIMFALLCVNIALLLSFIICFSLSVVDVGYGYMMVVGENGVW